jgi:hypothetical protein
LEGLRRGAEGGDVGGGTSDGENEDEHQCRVSAQRTHGLTLAVSDVTNTHLRRVSQRRRLREECRPYPVRATSPPLRRTKPTYAVASNSSMRPRLKPMMTSPPITMVGVPRLLYVSTSSCSAEGSSETLRSTKLTPFCERYSFALWQGPQPLAVYILIVFSDIYVSSIPFG